MSLGLPVWSGAMNRPKKNKQEKTHLDPALRNIEGSLSFDKKTKEALERSKTPGVILAEHEEPGKIYRIQIVGTKKVEPDAVILRLHSKIGEDYQPLLASVDLLEIRKMGFFNSDMKVIEVKRESGAIELIYYVIEIPTIFQIKTQGNKALSDEEIKESLAGLENYQGAKAASLQAAAQKIQDLYKSKGYFLAEVSYKITPTSEAEIKKRESEGFSEKTQAHATEIETAKVAAPDFVDVTFVINEHAKVKVTRIIFSGNKFLSDDELRENLRTHEEHLLSIVTDWGVFRQEYLDIDILIIEKLLHDKGFLKAKVLPPDVELSPDKSSISISYRMIEGPQYKLGEVSVTGDLLETDEGLYKLHQELKPKQTTFLDSEVLKVITQKEGMIFDKSKMAEDMQKIADMYRDKGYAYVDVTPIPNFDEEQRLVNISIQVMSGPQVRIERIDIEGNEKTKDEVIRGMLEIHEGDLYSNSLLTISRLNIERTGFFESVEFSNQPGSSPERMILVVKVKEQSTGGIQAGLGYGTGNEGLLVRLQISNQNLFGRGQSLSATVNWSGYRKMFDIMFTEPYLTYIFDNPLLFSISAYNRDVYMGEFNRLATGGEVTLGYPIGGPLSRYSRKWKTNAKPHVMPYIFDFDALWFYITYTAERVEISDTATDVRRFDLHQGVPRYTTSIKPAIRLDQRDNRISPTRGYYAEFSTEFATEYLGSKGLASLENHLRRRKSNPTLHDGRDFLKPSAQANNFIRYGANFRIYHNLDDWFWWKGFVFKAKFELGVLNTLGSPLAFENYMLGGMNTVRGYRYRSISPVERSGALVPFDARRDVAIGGNKEFLGSLELEFPLVKMLKLSGVLFFDFGNVWSHEDSFFFIGGKSANAARIKPTDPLGLYNAFGLYSGGGFGLRWVSPLGYLRFEWGIPLNRRPSNTPGLGEADRPIVFEFSMGSNF
jgi:outer membrane protein insertion porin family